MLTSVHGLLKVLSTEMAYKSQRINMLKENTFLSTKKAKSNNVCVLDFVQLEGNLEVILYF